MKYDVISPHRSICAGCERPKATWGWGAGPQGFQASAVCAMGRLMLVLEGMLNPVDSILLPTSHPRAGRREARWEPMAPMP